MCIYTTGGHQRKIHPGARREVYELGLGTGVAHHRHDKVESSLGRRPISAARPVKARTRMAWESQVYRASGQSPRLTDRLYFEYKGYDNDILAKSGCNASTFRAEIRAVPSLKNLLLSALGRKDGMHFSHVRGSLEKLGMGNALLLFEPFNEREACMFFQEVEIEIASGSPAVRPNGGETSAHFIITTERRDSSKTRPVRGVMWKSLIFPAVGHRTPKTLTARHARSNSPCALKSLLPKTGLCSWWIGSCTVREREPY